MENVKYFRGNVVRAGFKIYKLKVVVRIIDFDNIDDNKFEFSDTFRDKESARKAGMSFINAKVRYMYVRYFYGDCTYENFYKKYTTVIMPPTAKSGLKIKEPKIVIEFVIDEYDPLFYNEYNKYSDQFRSMAQPDEIKQCKYITYSYNQFGHEYSKLNKTV